jgi:outer membrane protein assembly factor BamB
LGIAGQQWIIATFGPHPGDDKLIVTSNAFQAGQDSVYALPIFKPGGIIWKQSVARPVGPAAKLRDVVLVAGNQLSVFGLSNGNPGPKYTPNSGALTGVATLDDPFIDATFIATTGGSVEHVAIDGTGRFITLWQKNPVPRATPYRPVLDPKGYLYVGYENGRVVAFEQNTGAEGWNLTVEANLAAEPTRRVGHSTSEVSSIPLDVSAVLIVSNTGHVKALHPKTGELIWQQLIAVGGGVDSAVATGRFFPPNE